MDMLLHRCAQEVRWERSGAHHTVMRSREMRVWPRQGGALIVSALRDAADAGVGHAGMSLMLPCRDHSSSSALTLAFATATVGNSRAHSGDPDRNCPGRSTVTTASSAGRVHHH
jgi:hypothetical protein